jgi:hypothetical protein
MDKFLFEKEIRTFGLRRSGNTMVVSYVFGHFKRGEIIALHNTNMSFNPSYSSKKKRMDTFKRKLDKCLGKQKCFFNSSEHIPIKHISANLYPGYCYDSQRMTFAVNYNCRRFSKDVYNILILRSPHNHLASILKNPKFNYLFDGNHYYGEFTDLWIQYAEEALGLTDELDRWKDRKIVLLFDKFVESQDYRRSVSNQLGLKFNDSGINRIGRRIGSSFNGRAYKDNAQEMKVNDRWKYLFDPGDDEHVWWDVESCRTKLLRPKVVHYTKKLFGVNLRTLF